MSTAQPKAKISSYRGAFLDKAQISMYRTLLADDCCGSNIAQGSREIKEKLKGFFLAEEAFMRRSGYQNILSHKASHCELILMVSEAINGANQPDIDGRVAGLSKAINRIFKHADTHDKLLQDYIGEHFTGKTNITQGWPSLLFTSLSEIESGSARQSR